MDVLTPSQYKILRFGWDQSTFTVDQLINSEIGAGRKDATLRTVCERIVAKGFLKAVKSKGEPVRYQPTVSKQKYMIMLAREWFGDATEEEKSFFRWAMDQA